MTKLKQLAHAAAGLFILLGAGAAVTLFVPDGHPMAVLSKALTAAQAFLVLGALNVYLMVKTPFRDVISENADALVDMERKWRVGKLNQAEATLAQAFAIEAVGRMGAIVMFAATAMAMVGLTVSF